MILKLDVPKKAAVEKYVRMAGGFIAFLIAVRLAADIAEKVKERQQNRKIRNLEQKVDSLEQKIAVLEKGAE